jgi:hypothetical protein
MTMFDVIFAPLVPLGILIGLAVVAAVATALAWWRGLSGWWLRGVAYAVVISILGNPMIRDVSSADLEDIAVVIVDRTSSNRLGNRPEQVQQTLDDLLARLGTRQGMRVRQIMLDDAPDNTGTRITQALNKVRAEIPPRQLSSIFVISDGQIHDTDTLDLEVPVHHIMTGDPADFDRQILIKQAPVYAILGEKMEITLQVQDAGALPSVQPTVMVTARVGASDPVEFNVPLGQDVTVQLEPPHAGRTVFELTVPTLAGEITDQNNRAIAQVNVIRDRLRVLLVSGMPHPGARVWRNLLKSDSSVDLVHFTILRPPGKQDDVPVSELSLIAFPTRELFLEKIDDFDLIIFDRYKRRGILPSAYLQNIVDYVRNGGAVLVSAGPDFASANSISRSPLGDILPVVSNSRIITDPYVPQVSEFGARHPVTQDLPNNPDWGRWFRQVDLNVTRGQTVMTGAQDKPLLVLDRVDQGRVALIASDQVWLWYRQFEQGGPQQELLRRVAHWLMQEPDLEEEALSAVQQGSDIVITRRTLADQAPPLTLTAPSGGTTEIEARQIRPGVFQAQIKAPENGIYDLRDDTQAIVFAKGAVSPIEFQTPLATNARIAALTGQSGGGVIWAQTGVPVLRDIDPNRPASGNGWMGVVRNQSKSVLDVSTKPFAPVWLMLLCAIGAAVAAWLREGRNA